MNPELLRGRAAYARVTIDRAHLDEIVLGASPLPDQTPRRARLGSKATSRRCAQA